MTTLVFSLPPAGPDDPQRTNRWIAERTVEQLQTLGLPVSVVDDAHADRAGLESALSPGHCAGVALFTHGDEWSLGSGSGDPVLDSKNVEHLRGRWAHAFACLSGVELAGLAVSAGCTLFAGYHAGLILNWTPEDVPPALQLEFLTLLTTVTAELAQGERDPDRLRRLLFARSEPIIAWCDEHPDLGHGLGITAQQLLSSLVVRQCSAE